MAPPRGTNARAMWERKQAQWHQLRLATLGRPTAGSRKYWQSRPAVGFWASSGGVLRLMWTRGKKSSIIVPDLGAWAEGHPTSCECGLFTCPGTIERSISDQRETVQQAFKQLGKKRSSVSARLCGHPTSHGHLPCSGARLATQWPSAAQSSQPEPAQPPSSQPESRPAIPACQYQVESPEETKEIGNVYDHLALVVALLMQLDYNDSGEKLDTACDTLLWLTTNNPHFFWMDYNLQSLADQWAEYRALEEEKPEDQLANATPVFVRFSVLSTRIVNSQESLLRLSKDATKPAGLVKYALHKLASMVYELELNR